MKQELLEFNVEHNQRINAILYHTHDKMQLNIVLIIHGACMNFLCGPSYFIPKFSKNTMTDFCTINCRAHDMGMITSSYHKKEGWAWQTREKNIQDIECAIKELKKIGYKKIILCGHSWGALVCMDYLQKNKYSVFDGVILLSPTISYKLLLEVNYREKEAETIKLVNELKKKKSNMEQVIACAENAMIPFMSAKTIYDFSGNDVDFRNIIMRKNQKYYFIVGSKEHKKLIDILSDFEKKNENVYLFFINEGNHFYKDKEEELTLLIDNIVTKIWRK